MEEANKNIIEDTKVKSGKEILDDFFKEISSIENVDKKIAESLAELYTNGKLTDKNVVNELQKIRTENGNEN
ncbi:hypothetical protein [Chryseobacterium sp. RR2-3-20]|uniref:hypothetical protein n=1 Tax=Chryseobacterium sp. RR2-3-20 TaxID=2787626 RepID=UPI001AE0A830|nr:hypothetical protein [Chryseobacterium sp. RR2-3-20]